MARSCPQRFWGPLSGAFRSEDFPTPGAVGGTSSFPSSSTRFSRRSPPCRSTSRACSRSASSPASASAGCSSSIPRFSQSTSRRSTVVATWCSSTSSGRAGSFSPLGSGTSSSSSSMARGASSSLSLRSPPSSRSCSASRFRRAHTTWRGRVGSRKPPACFADPNVLALFLVISAVAQFPGYAASMVLVEKWGRKKTLALFLILGGISGYVFATAGDFTTLVLGLVFVSFFNLGAWGAVYPYTSELFPTEYRATGFGVAEGVGKITAVLAPIAFGALLLYTNGVLWPLTTVALLMLVGGLVAGTLGPETKGVAFH